MEDYWKPVPDPFPVGKAAGIIIVITALITFPIVLYPPIIGVGCGCTWDQGGDHFPTIDVSLSTGSSGSHLTIKHLQGDPLDISEYRIIITDNSDEDAQADLEDLVGMISAGDSLYFNEDNAPGFDAIEYREGQSYTVEIYDKHENKRVFVNLNVECK